MLKVNVGLSRKVSRDYNSTGFSVNLEGEVCAPLDDPELVVEKIRELYDLAEESLDQQVERYEGESAMASRDEQLPQVSQNRFSRQPPTNGRNQENRSTSSNGNGHSRGGNEPAFTPATNKQIQYLLTLGKRQGLTKPQLERRVVEIVDREVGLYDLSKT
ncbi:MAG: hypothetical protein WD049_10195, partial [Candidatus Paceibacterota bacterium]